MLKCYAMPNCYVMTMLRNTLPCLLLLLSVIRILYKAGVWSRHCKLEFKKHVFPILIKPESKRAPSRHLLLTRSIGNIFRFGSGMPSRNICEGRFRLGYFMIGQVLVMVELGHVRFRQRQDQIGSGQIWAGTGQRRTGQYLLFVWVILLVVLALDSRMPVCLVVWDQYYLGPTVSLASKQYILF